MTNLIMYNTLEELEKLTGLNRDELWNNGFDLDDWTVGFQSDKVIPEESWLIWEMCCYACGYKQVPYKGKYYYMVYHS